jgi:hypothetical protein
MSETKRRLFNHNKQQRAITLSIKSLIIPYIVLLDLFNLCWRTLEPGEQAYQSGPVDCSTEDPE